jgi:hypothetical protein
MNTRRSSIAGIVALFLLAPAHGQETVKPLDAEWATFAIITGFHHAFDTQSQFEVRLLEADRSVTVAMNPVALYVVITNNSSGADVQHYVWRLPQRVSKVKGVKLSPPILQIRAETDADPWDSSKRVGKVLSVQYSISHGVLSDTLSVSDEPLR